MNMHLEGVVAYLDGFVDHQGDAFSKNMELIGSPRVPLRNNRGENIGSATLYETSQEGRRVIRATVEVDTPRSRFYKACAQEGLDLYLALGGMVQQEQKIVQANMENAMLIEKVSPTNVILCTRHADHRIPSAKVTTNLFNSDPVFEKAYDEAYGTRPADLVAASMDLAGHFATAETIRTNVVDHDLKPELKTNIAERPEPNVLQISDIVELLPFMFGALGLRR